MGEIEMRVCNRCGVEQPIFNYHKNGNRRKSICKKCANIAQRLRRVKKGERYPQTLCWRCQKATGHCSWSEIDTTDADRPVKFKPVLGWDAIKTQLECGRRNTSSYLILSCPEFVPDEMGR